MMEQRHPFKEIRTANKLSQNDVAEACDISHQVVVRSEQGLYGMPSPKLLHYLATLEESGTVAELKKMYKDWQTQHRIYHKVKIEQPLLKLRAENPYGKFTMPQLKTAMNCTSSVGFCKLICVQPSQVDRYTRLGGSLFFLEEALRDVVSEDLVKWVVSHLRPS